LIATAIRIKSGQNKTKPTVDTIKSNVRFTNLSNSDKGCLPGTDPDPDHRFYLIQRAAFIYMSSDTSRLVWTDPKIRPILGLLSVRGFPTEIDAGERYRGGTLAARRVLELPRSASGVNEAHRPHNS
jgi:hypothetical protein